MRLGHVPDGGDGDKQAETAWGEDEKGQLGVTARGPGV